MLVFPPNPNIGDTYLSWTWTGSGWFCGGGGGGGGANVTIGATPPSPAAQGDLWWDSVNGVLFVRFGDHWVQANCGGGDEPFPEAPTDGRVYGRDGQAEDWKAVLPLSGGTLSGPGHLTMAGLTATGLTVNSSETYQNAPAGFSAHTYLNAPSSGFGSALVGQNAGRNRWAIYPGNGDPETGGNAGSNFAIARFPDAGGTAISTQLTINRATGQTTIGASTSNNPLLLLANGSADITYSAGPTTWALGNYSGTGFVLSNAGTTRWYIDTNGFMYHVSTVAYKIDGGPWDTLGSDARIKNIDGDYGAGLDVIKRLQPKVYSYKGNDDLHADVPREQKFIGLIAQDVEGAMPEMVKKNAGKIDGRDVDDYRSMNTGPLIYALVNAVKELAVEVDALKVQLARMR